jgi:hypothetical protein
MHFCMNLITHVCIKISTARNYVDGKRLINNERDYLRGAAAIFIALQFGPPRTPRTRLAADAHITSAVR